MKNFIITIAVIVIAAIAAFVLFKPKPPFKNAEIAESHGNYKQAINHYVEALREATEGMKLVDKNRSKIISPQEWYSEVHAYMKWADADNKSATSEISKIISALSQCTTFIESNQFITDDSVHKYSDTAFFELKADWQRAFFPKGVTVEGNHEPLMKEALNRNLSLLRIRSRRSYTYDGMILDLGSWKRTDFKLYPEDEVSLLVDSGEYLLICKALVEFPDGTLWRSPQNIIHLHAPDSSSLKTFLLKTRVKRGGSGTD